MNEKQLQRVFMHEIGHYTARTLNLKIRKKGAGISKIWFKKEVKGINSEYIGGIDSIKPKNFVNDGTIKDKPEFIANLTYGCIFQTLYESRFQSNEFSECFCNKADLANDIRAHGINDYGNLNYNFGEEFTNKITEYIENSYLVFLQQNMEHLKKLFQVNFEDYLIIEGQNMFLDLNNLEKGLENFFYEHTPYFEKFLNDIEILLKHER